MNFLSIFSTNADTRQTLSSLYSRYEYWLIGIALIVATWLLHGSALHGFWRLHDGMLLLFALQHSPMEYFFDPTIVAEQSSHLTPWNVLFYDINLSLFGLEPKWHYAHLLMLAWAGSFLSYVLFRIYTGSVFAFLGALFFLAGLPTVESTQQLMSAHYLTGLIFTQLSIYFYISSLTKDNGLLFAVIGAIFYLMATACKEVYVPLVVVLPFLPIKGYRERIISLIPFIAAAILYIAWRFFMIDSFLGGYRPHLHGLAVIDILKQLLQIPMILFGSGWYGVLALAVIAGFLVNAVIRKQLSWPLVIVSAVALLFPLIPLTIYPGLNSGNNRYFYFLWWGVCVLLTFLLSQGRTSKSRLFMVFVGIYLFAAVSSYSVTYKTKYLDRFNSYSEQLYHFVLGQQPGLLLIEGNLVHYWKRVLYSMINVNKILHANSQPSAEPVDIVDLFEMRRFQSNKDVFEYNPHSDRVENVNNLLPRKFNRLMRRFAKDVNLSVSLKYDGKQLQWLFRPFTNGRYKIYYLDTKGERRVVNVPSQGSIEFLPTQDFNFYFCYMSPKGWIVQSPELSYNPALSPTFEWNGNSVIPYAEYESSSR